MFGCGDISTHTNEPPPPVGSKNVSDDPNHPIGNTVVILGSDFGQAGSSSIGTLSVLTVDTPRTATSNIQVTHSDAIVRSFNNKLYVVNRLGGDNIQIVDPSQDFKVTLQCSTGNGTNPQDIMIVSPTKGYVTLLNPSSSQNSKLVVADVLVVNLAAKADCSDFITKTIDLSQYVADDNEPFARASSMVVIGSKVFIALQNLPKDLSLAPDQPGKIVKLDTTTDTIVDSLILDGRNPFDMDYSPETKKIYISDASFHDLSTSFGGIEVVDPDTLTTEGILIDDLDLGASPGPLEVSGTMGFTIVSTLDPKVGSRVVSFDLKNMTASGVKTVYQGKKFIQSIAVDQNGFLLIGDRDPNINGILFFDPDTGAKVDGPINTGPLPSSITFVDR
jgi:hypothetical protein